MVQVGLGAHRWLPALATRAARSLPLPPQLTAAPLPYLHAGDCEVLEPDFDGGIRDASSADACHTRVAIVRQGATMNAPRRKQGQFALICRRAHFCMRSATLEKNPSCSSSGVLYSF